MQLTIDELIRDFVTYENVINDLLTDIKNSSRSSIIYNVDFSLLFEHIWGKSPSAIPPFKPYGKIFQNLIHINRFNPKFQLVFSGPSFWELLDSIVHEADQIGFYQFAANSHYKEIQRILKDKTIFASFEQVLMNSGFASRQLELLNDKGVISHIRTPIQRAFDLIDKGKILRGLGEIVKLPGDIANTYKDLYGEMLEQMLHKRIDDRDIDARTFHFGVDSANIIATNAINATNPQMKLYFVTQPYLKSRYCPHYGRNPLVPFFWISVLRLKEINYINSEESFLMKMKETATEIKKELIQANNFDNVSKLLELEVVDFYAKYLRPLKETKQSQLKDDDAVSDTKFRELISDPNKFKKRFKDVKEELVEGAKDLANLKQDLLEDDYSEMMDVHEDPVVKRIKSVLRI